MLSQEIFRARPLGYLAKHKGKIGEGIGGYRRSVDLLSARPTDEMQSSHLVFSERENRVGEEDVTTICRLPDALLSTPSSYGGSNKHRMLKRCEWETWK
jgi:hypothetical protein